MVNSKRDGSWLWYHVKNVVAHTDPTWTVFSIYRWVYYYNSFKIRETCVYLTDRETNVVLTERETNNASSRHTWHNLRLPLRTQLRLNPQPSITHTFSNTSTFLWVIVETLYLHGWEFQLLKAKRPFLVFWLKFHFLVLIFKMKTSNDCRNFNELKEFFFWKKNTQR